MDREILKQERYTKSDIEAITYTKINRIVKATIALGRNDDNGMYDGGYWIRRE